MRTRMCLLGIALLICGGGAVSANDQPIRTAQAPTVQAPASSAAPPAATEAPAAPAPAAPATTGAPASAAPAAAAPSAASPAAVSPPEKLVGLAAWNQLVGNSITGQEDGKSLTEYYAPDGTAKSMSGNEISRGTWALAGEIVCFKYTDEPKPECYRIEVAGNTATMYDEKGSGTRYEILKGNPKGL